MANYDSNYEIAQEISARIGNSPIPFDSVYSICLEIYRQLGGEEENFDSVYSILLEILPLVEGGGANVIDDTSIRLDKTWSSSKINSEIEAHSGATYTAGQNISIDASNNISADGYVFDSSNGSLATICRQDQADGGELVANVATGLYGSYAEGYLTIASGNYGSHAEGQLTEASGSSAHAEGNGTSASGKFSHAEGYGSIASGQGAHAEGYITSASGILSHTEGYQTIASGDYSHAEGCRVKRGNNYFYTTASGTKAHAEGEATSAEGQASHTEGAETQALNAGEHAEGVLNLSHKVSNDERDAGNTRHSVGIGWFYKSDPSTLYRTNAEEIMANGDQYIIGIGGYEGTDTKIQNASIKTLQEVINSKADAYEVATTADIEALFTEPAPTAPADNEIWYTTESGELWEPYDAYNGGDTLQINGNTLLSNTYENGHGVLRYTNNITELSDYWGASDYEHNTNITSITFPHSITYIGNIMSYGNSDLNTINYNGTVAECSEIDMSYFMIYSDFSPREIVCTDGVYNPF